ncbi:unnamed protein product [Cryptosporidium hominis]|uniref:Uncharacterized protein n=1 Tax=Cryptosporidium hominis TaxID=237895 RepID=A0A0S4TIN0_CRYHO|nr:hypothetical protein [Cryptosporidium hominis TU502]OLQ17579.1 hypothetical protein ChTU502y2012_406g0585 [Cryptosporidium hominis]PPA64835.1 hypothetical protein ChUKH1_02145 [Cryptosporidium hominis]PPS97760.1 Uncharacterized protein GY17_00000176 [Cryptosporidium hominis]CUV06597.1 unnamed protein product [Cryptosporidium hominis]|eukprot:PPS97760.1 Uncharacterized protein GY17_00000176 [Cryptosporidium hominis]
MDEECFNVHSPGVFEVRKAGKSFRKSAPAVVRAIPRVNKRYAKPPFSVEQLEKICADYIRPYRQIYRNAVLTYTERKIKSKRKCELFRKVLLNRENLYFNSLKKCVIFDTDWAKEKLKQEENKIISLTNNETKSLIDVYLLRSVANEKTNKQRELLVKLKQFWSEYPEKLNKKIEFERNKVLDMMKLIGESKLKGELVIEATQDISMNLSRPNTFTNNDKFSLEQLEQIRLMATGYEVTTGKFSVMINNLTQRIDHILGAEKRLNNVAKALVLNSEK